MFDGEEIVKRGSWMYGGVAPSAIVITRGSIFYGSGDYEDPPDVTRECPSMAHRAGSVLTVSDMFSSARTV